MRNVFELVRETQILQDDSYIVSYPHLLDYFASAHTITPGDVVRGAHMAYGWMPTILELYPENGERDLAAAANILTRAREVRHLESDDFEALAALVNNSLVGASKLLHFVAPENFPIWDSKTYAFVYGKRPHYYRVNNVAIYIEYIALLEKLAAEDGFASFHNSVDIKLGYHVSPLRALELIMFLNAPVYGG
jgi:hypothetical protein